MTVDNIKYAILKEVSDHNIVPLTSKCNIKCKFCSHQYNSCEVSVIDIGYRPLDEVLWSLDYLDSSRDIIIGESATHIIEGEPLIYPHWQQVVSAIRKRFPHTCIRITTNGTMLSEENIAFLASMMPIYINLSLNSANPKNRTLLVNDKKPETAINAPKLLAKYGIPYQGSIVAMSMLVGYDDIAESIRYLADNGAEMVRLLVPGFSNGAEYSYDFSREQMALAALIDKLKLKTPILLEPPMYGDNLPYVKGVIAGSLCDGLVYVGDIITSIDGELPYNRYDAYMKLYNKKKCRIKLNRQGEDVWVELVKDKGLAGIIMENDLDISRLMIIRKFIGTGDNLLLCSPFGEPYLRHNLYLLGDVAHKVTIKVCDNHYFGGNIMCAGLLTIRDIKLCLDEFLCSNPKPDVVFLPYEMFDQRYCDVLSDSLNSLSYDDIKFEII